MKKVLFFTRIYPFGSGEEFIETEILYWAHAAEKKKCEVVIVPQKTTEVLRDIPKSISLDLSFCKLKENRFSLTKVAIWFASTLKKDFFRELCLLRSSGRLSFRNLFNCLRYYSKASYNARFLRDFFEVTGADIVYHYWCDHAAFSSLLVKEYQFKLLARAHGFDLYEDRNKHAYIPYRAMFIEKFPQIFSISKNGKDYITHNYIFRHDNVSVRHLGVVVPAVESQPSGIDSLKIVSVSSCTWVKRIDKIIDAIALLRQKRPSLLIEWTHIGAGSLMDNLTKRANFMLQPLDVDFKFLGHIANKSVLEFFESNPVDLLINTSDSEGIPVAMMEAMAYGIPCIGPNVGGIFELIGFDAKWVIPSECNPHNIAHCIESNITRVKSKEVRMLFKDIIIKYFNASKNYEEFIEEVCI